MKLRNVSFAAFLTCSTMLAAVPSATAAIATVRIASGFSRPVFVTSPPGDTNRLFVVEQRGLPASTSARIMIIDLTTNTVLPTPFLTISAGTTGSNVSISNEQGLLGLAFDPNYATNFRFYVNYTAPGGGTAGHTRISRFTAPSATSNVANNAEQVLITLNDPFTNHNGGWLGFGPDGYLYVAMGDSGSANDPSGNAQNLNSIFGKLWRVDVSGAGAYAVPPTNPFPGAAGLNNIIWAYGLRNPWRCSFDRLTGQLYIGDVGQNAVEEVDVQPADVGGSMGGRNYGWRCMEGTTCTGLTGCTCNAANLVPPVTTYTHATGISLTGGYVYRGAAIPEIYGHYFFADYSSAVIFSMQYTGVNNPPITNRTAQLAPGGGLGINTITSFGEDAAGEMYIIDQAGEIFKIIPGIPPAPANDLCANGTIVGAGVHAFTNVNALTDGPLEPACANGGDSNIAIDVWFRYAAQCTGNATISLCGANYNAKMAVYGPCPVGSGATLACSDDFCGTAPQVTFPVVTGTIYRVRIGGFNGATGSGTMVITCTVPPPPCPADIDDNLFVNVDDLLAVINSWGRCPPPCPTDIAPPPSGNGFINVDDLLAIVNAWGPCPP